MKIRPLLRQIHLFKSIRAEITAVFSLLILLTALLVGLVSYGIWVRSVERNAQDYSMQLIRQVDVNIGSYINYMEDVSQLVINNSDVKNYLATDFKTASEKEGAQRRVSEQFSSILQVRSDISNILILSRHDSFVLNDPGLEINPYSHPYLQSWYRKALTAGGKAVISPSHVQNVVQDQYRWVVSLSRGITDSDGSQSGVLLVDLNYSIIENICRKVNLGNRGYIFIVDKTGNIVYHPQQQLIYSGIIREATSQVMHTKTASFLKNENGEKKLYSVINSASTGWKIVGVSYLDEMIPDRTQMQSYYFVSVSLLLFIVLLVSVLVSFRISRPILKLEMTMKEAEKGNLDARVHLIERNEIGRLGSAFNRMTAEIQELMKQNTIEQELKRKSELKALQTQINPHFLYNTLDSIIWMAEDKRFDDVVLMTSSLAKLFRLSISSDGELTTLANEVEHIRSYLTIQKMRYQDKLDFAIHTDAGALRCKVFKILLQPFVENAIYHGIRNKPGGGFIGVTGERRGDRLLLTVRDNGVGMTQETLKNILSPKKRSGNGHGVGIANVGERIRLYFGEGYGLHYESECGMGTTVTITLPVME